MPRARDCLLIRVTLLLGLRRGPIWNVCLLRWKIDVSKQAFLHVRVVACGVVPCQTKVFVEIERAHAREIYTPALMCQY